MAKPAPKATIVGEGLVGSVLSLHLAERGCSVEVYERRPDPRRERTRGGRSINLAISTRGLHALEQVGLRKTVLKRAIPMMGRMVHPVSGEPAFQRYGKDDSEHINSISRAWLNEVLIDHAERSKKVRIRFGKNVLGMDFRSGKLRVKDEKSGKISEIAAGPVLGTDGSASAIRRDMLRRPGFDCSQKRLDHGYKELTIPAGAGGKFLMEKNALHIWPRRSFMLIALPNFEGSFTATLFLPFEGPASFESLGSPRSIDAFFEEQFPDFAGLVPDLSAQFLRNPTGSMTTIKCRPWNVADKALLLGDAAHAIVPFFGQGMNCGFEDCTVLAECLDRGEPLEATFERFMALRKPDADAIADMAVENFIEMRDRVADPRFLLEKKVERLLQFHFPSEYVPRYALVTFSRVPYSLAQRAGVAQGRILAELLDGVSDPEKVDLRRAKDLIDRELSPILKEAR